MRCPCSVLGRVSRSNSQTQNIPTLRYVITPSTPIDNLMNFVAYNLGSHSEKKKNTIDTYTVSDQLTPGFAKRTPSPWLADI